MHKVVGPLVIKTIKYAEPKGNDANLRNRLMKTKENLINL